MANNGKISLELIQQLRERTGLGMLDCRKALEESAGDLEQAIENLRKKGAAKAAKRAGNVAAEGLVHAYIHPGSRIGVMVEINCETDFVARTEDVKQFAQDICLHITALKPMYLEPANVDEKFIAHEREIFKAQLAESGKPEKIIDQIVEGKITKLYDEVCLLRQAFVKNDQMTVADVLDGLKMKMGEKIVIKRFARYEIGVY
jgi:elongation factor Ts